MSTKKDLEYWFPNIVGKSYNITFSNFDFNCVAFTLNIYDDYIWTNEKSWPYNLIPRVCNIESFKKLYELYNYQECFDELYEEGYEKIAFYAKNNTPIHAAKQFDKNWKSKISNLVVEHELNWLCGDTQDAYDNVVFIMKRQNKD